MQHWSKTAFIFSMENFQGLLYINGFFVNNGGADEMHKLGKKVQFNLIFAIANGISRYFKTAIWQAFLLWTSKYFQMLKMGGKYFYLWENIHFQPRRFPTISGYFSEWIKVYWKTCSSSENAMCCNQCSKNQLGNTWTVKKLLKIDISEARI